MFYLDILEAFYKEGIEYLIVGGLAVNLHGVPRVTQDMDIILSMDKMNILKAVSVLKGMYYLPRIPCQPEQLANSAVVQSWVKDKNMIAFSFFNEQESYKTIDIIISHHLNFSRSFENRVIKKMQSFEVYVAAIDDIIAMKGFSGREQDKSDIEMLQKVKEIESETNG